MSERTLAERLDDIEYMGQSIKPPVSPYGVVDSILKELARAETKHPTWPADIIHQVSIMGEEAGEAIKAALNYVYEDGDIEEVRKEAIHTGAMAIRVLMNLECDNG